MNNSPIFIIASERSGTNLLRSLLSNHPNLEGPLATHLLDVFYKVKDLYGLFEKKENVEKLYNHFKTSVNHPYTNWKFEINFEDFYAKHQPKTFLEVYNAFHVEKVGEQKRYVCKDKNLYDYIPQIHSEIKNAKFLYLYRDARDYVVSNLKNPRALWTVYDNAKAWNHEQNVAFNQIEKVNIDVLYIKYEDLVNNTPQIMTKVLNFIGEPVDENCFSTDSKKNKNVTWNKHWENLDKPVLKNNYNKFLDKLSQNEINLIETICKNNLIRLGYELHTDANWTKPFLHEKRNRFSHLFKKLMRVRYVYGKQKLSYEKGKLNRSLLSEIRETAK